MSRTTGRMTKGLECRYERVTTCESIRWCKTISRQTWPQSGTAMSVFLCPSASGPEWYGHVVGLRNREFLLGPKCRLGTPQSWSSSSWCGEFDKIGTPRQRQAFATLRSVELLPQSTKVAVDENVMRCKLFGTRSCQELRRSEKLLVFKNCAILVS